MAPIRLSPTEVQVHGIVYMFSDVDIADDFEACIAMTDAHYCELEHPPVSKRLADSNHQGH